ncbi:putative peroxidase [Helianthus annuus]|nr:putative peroxidase [Helianthus annuus]
MNNMLIVMFGMIIPGYILTGISEARLKVGFYNKMCPDAESIVGGFVRSATEFDPRVPAFLLRLHFHDCFVQGCDGSVLIDNGPISEKLAPAHQGLKGFDVIEGAKALLELMCPGVVSCADIVAIAARDAVAISSGPIYKVETGRRDGFISNKTLADKMPDFRDSIQLLKHKFFEKGLGDKDLVVLSDQVIMYSRYILRSMNMEKFDDIFHQQTQCRIIITRFLYRALRRNRANDNVKQT